MKPGLWGDQSKKRRQKQQWKKQEKHCPTQRTSQDNRARRDNLPALCTSLDLCASL